MKRCPQCDFIYENEQGLCDMDGRELVHVDTALLVPENVSLVARPAKPGRKSRWKPRWMSYAVLPVGGVALGASLFLINHALTPQATPPPHNAARPSDPAHISNAAPPSADINALPTPSPNPPAAPRDDTDDASAAPSRSHDQTPTTSVRTSNRATARHAPTPAPAADTIKREEKRSKPETENKKKESKLGSILKKTGRVLKKPFGF